MRNFQAVLTREAAVVADAEGLVQDSAAVRDELKVEQRLLANDEERLQVLNDEFPEIEVVAKRHDSTPSKPRTIMESAYRDLERRQLLTIASAFPNIDETARYLLAKLFSDEQCLACGTSAPDVAAELRAHLTAHECIVCGSPLHQETSAVSLTPCAIARDNASGAHERALGGNGRRAAIFGNGLPISRHSNSRGQHECGREARPR